MRRATTSLTLVLLALGLLSMSPASASAATYRCAAPSVSGYGIRGLAVTWKTARTEGVLEARSLARTYSRRLGSDANIRTVGPYDCSTRSVGSGLSEYLRVRCSEQGVIVSFRISGYWA